MEDSASSPLAEALAEGDPERVARLLDEGADLHYRREDGYDALIDAVHGRDIGRDPRLCDLLRLLIARGAELSGITKYYESGLRVLSHVGRFDGVRVLLEAGADETHLRWTPLFRAVALGTLADVEAALAAGAELEAKDTWGRTAWHVALVVGSVEKAALLHARGADVNAHGRFAEPAFGFALVSRRPEVLKYLLGLGQSPDALNEFETTPLMAAVDNDDLENVELLLAAGADPDRMSPSGSVLSRAASRAVAARLLAAGANPAELRSSGQRLLVGLPGDPDKSLLTASRDEFRLARTRRFGRTNPERIDEPFWLAMVRSGVNAYEAASHFNEPTGDPKAPVWCAQRFGQSITELPDGRFLRIAGEHEDHYDADFCIYSDVFVHHPDGRIELYAYPEAEFPPTDFHTATLAGDFVYLVGSLGYFGKRVPGSTFVRRLDTTSLYIETLATTGELPGWIYDHRAKLASQHEIRIWGGKVVTLVNEREEHTENADAFVIDLKSRVWRREPASAAPSV